MEKKRRNKRKRNGVERVAQDTMKLLKNKQQIMNVIFLDISFSFDFEIWGHKINDGGES